MLIQIKIGRFHRIYSLPYDLTRSPLWRDIKRDIVLRTGILTAPPGDANFLTPSVFSVSPKCVCSAEWISALPSSRISLVNVRTASSAPDFTGIRMRCFVYQGSKTIIGWAYLIICGLVSTSILIRTVLTRWHTVLSPIIATALACGSFMVIWIIAYEGCIRPRNIIQLKKDALEKSEWLI